MLDTLALITMVSLGMRADFEELDVVEFPDEDYLDVIGEQNDHHVAGWVDEVVDVEEDSDSDLDEYDDNAGETDE